MESGLFFLEVPIFALYIVVILGGKHHEEAHSLED